MTQEQRDTIRADYASYIAYEVATTGGTGGGLMQGSCNRKGRDNFLMWLADGGVDVLLDALDEAENRKKKLWDDYCTLCEIADTNQARAEKAEKEIEQYEAERNCPVTGSINELLEIVTLLHADNYSAYSRAVDIIQCLPLDMTERDRLRDTIKGAEACVAIMTEAKVEAERLMIDGVNAALEERDQCADRADAAEQAAVEILMQFREKCGWCREYRKGNCKHDNDWNACNAHRVKRSIEQVEADWKEFDEMQADRDRYKARCEALERAMREKVVSLCRVCEHMERIISANEPPCLGCLYEKDHPHFEFDEARFAAPEGGEQG